MSAESSHGINLYELSGTPSDELAMNKAWGFDPESPFNVANVFGNLIMSGTVLPLLESTQEKTNVSI